MNTVKLKKGNCLYQIVRHGYFAEQFPTCFSSHSMSKYLSDLSPLVLTSKSQRKSKNTTSPTQLSMFKNDVSRRVLSVPNPEAFLRLSKFISENWDKIHGFTISKKSLSPISFIRSYADKDEELINCESLREALRSKSDFINGIKQNIRISLGYKYQLKANITNCYNSMYTHSIAWAICGKNAAKTYLRTKEPKSIEADYELADLLDCFTRYEKNDETNGIIVGPFTSRIVSELILARIDKILSDKGLIFVRYVDDYKFYFRSEAQAKESLTVIENVLNDFNLSLNSAKTEIRKFPYEIISDIKSKYEYALKKEGVFGVLNIASQLHQSGEKGAFKYALKYLRGRPLPDNESLQLVIPILINTMLLDPKYGRYVTDYLKANIESINPETLTSVFNIELSKSLEGELQQESLLFIQLIRDLNLAISGKNIINVLNSENDFAIIIALDLWKNRNNKIIRKRTEAYQIKKAIKALADTLNGEKLSGSRWLLLYEIIANRLLDEDLIPEIEMDDFFKKMYSLGITFYKSVTGE